MDILIFTDDNGWIGFARYAGAYRIATELRQAGFSVKVVDFFASMKIEDVEKILEKYVTADTLFVGFATSLWVQSGGYNFFEYMANSYEAHLKSLFPHNVTYMNRLFDKAKNLSPEVRFVVGGSKAESLGSDRIDHWVVGQGEVIAVELAQKLKEKKFSEIPKILEGKKKSYDAFSSSVIEWTDEDQILPGECLPVEIARGCIFRCAFCYYPLNGKKKGDYIKPKEHLKNEILRVHEKFGTETFLFTDDLINDSPEKVHMLYEIAQELPFKIEWSGFCRLDMIHAYPEMAELLMKSGMRAVYFGIETLHKEAGLKSGKALGYDRIMKTLAHVKSVWGNRVMITAGFIAGLPKEPKESIQRTLDWLMTEECPIDVADIGVLNIKARNYLTDMEIYNSRIGENPEEFGLDVTPTYWRHDLMDSKQAYELVSQFYSNPAFANKKRGAPFTMYPRLKNLGFTYEEISRASLGDQRFREEAVLRRKNIFNNYLTRLLSP